MQRENNARICQDGASNPRRVASCLVEAIDECRQANIDPTTDDSVYLIAHQLNYILFRVDIAGVNPGRYSQAYDNVMVTS